MFQTPLKNSVYDILSYNSSLFQSLVPSSNIQQNFVSLDSNLENRFFLNDLEAHDKNILNSVEISSNVQLKVKVEQILQEKNQFIHSLASKNQKFEYELQQLLNVNSELNSNVESLETENLDFSKKIICLSDQINVLTEKLDELGNYQDFIEQNGLINRDIQNNHSIELLLKENLNLKEQLSLWEKTFLETNEKNEKIENLENYLNRIEEEVKTLRENERKNRLKDETKKEFFEGETRVLNLTQEIQDLQNQIECLQQNKINNEKKLCELEAIVVNFEKSQNTIYNQNIEINRLLEGNAYYERIQNEYLMTIENLREKLLSKDEESNQNEDSLKVLREKIQNEKFQRKTLQAELQNVSNILSASSEKIQNLKKELGSTKGELQKKIDFICSLQEKQENLDKDIHELSLQMQSCQLKNEQITKLCQEKELQKINLENNLKEQIEENLKKVKELNSQNKILENLKAENRNQNSKIQEFEIQISSQNEEIIKLKKIISSKEIETKDFKNKLSESNENVQKLTSQNEKLNSRVYFLEQEISILNEKAKTADKKVKEMAGLLQESKEAIELSKSEKDSLELQIERSKREQTLMQRKIHDFEISQKEIEAKGSEYEGKYLAIEEQLSINRKKLAKESEEKGKLLHEIEELKSLLLEANESLDSQGQSLRETKRAIEKEKNLQNESILTLQKALEEAKEEEMRNLESAENFFKEQIQRGIDEINALRIENQNLETYASDLLFDVKRLTLENERLSAISN